ncbi:hypothetical protein SLE2022_112220 [Rubroshorea leprosula]
MSSPLLNISKHSSNGQLSILSLLFLLENCRIEAITFQWVVTGAQSSGYNTASLILLRMDSKRKVGAEQPWRWKS